MGKKRRGEGRDGAGSALETVLVHVPAKDGEARLQQAYGLVLQAASRREGGADGAEDAAGSLEPGDGGPDRKAGGEKSSEGV